MKQSEKKMNVRKMSAIVETQLSIDERWSSRRNGTNHWIYNFLNELFVSIGGDDDDNGHASILPLLLLKIDKTTNIETVL